jgi:hypothetical protein
MLRMRLASLALASTLLVSSGCSTSNWCSGGGPFSNCSWFGGGGGGAPVMMSAPVSGYVGGGGPCECANGGIVGSTNFHEGAMVVPQGAIVTQPPGPISGVQQQSPPQQPNGQAPRIITMPNAPATPYNP